MLKSIYDPNNDAVIATAQLDTGLTLVDGTRPFTGTVGGIDPVASTDLTTKEYVDTAVSGRWEYFYNNTASGIGAYYSMGVPTGEAESSFSTAGLGTGDNQALTSFITDAAVGYTTIRAGIISVHVHAEKTAGTKPVTIHAGIYERTAGGVETLIATTENSGAVTAKAEQDIHATVTSDYAIASTSKLVVKFLANVGAAGSDATVALYAEGTTSSEVSVAAPMTGTFHSQNTDTRIQDADADTKIQTEESADEDIIRMDTAGVETLKISAVGIVSMAKQSGCYVSYASGQYMPASGGFMYALFDTEAYDVQNEFDKTVKTGTASATTASHLIDTVANQFTAADVGDFIWNTTTNVYAKVTAFNSISDLTLSINIMTSGQGYKIYKSRFTATEGGTYIASLFLQLNGNSVDGNYIQGTIEKNDVTAFTNIVYAPGTNLYVGISVTGIMNLSAGDAITFGGFQPVASAKQLYPAATSAYAFIAKIS